MMQDSAALSRCHSQDVCTCQVAKSSCCVCCWVVVCLLQGYTSAPLVCLVPAGMSTKDMELQRQASDIMIDEDQRMLADTGHSMYQAYRALTKVSRSDGLMTYPDHGVAVASGLVQGHSAAILKGALELLHLGGFINLEKLKAAYDL